MDIRLLEGAKEDLRNAWFFDERQATGLGDRLLDAIETDVGLLPGYAGIHLQVDGFHRMLIKCFPFALYYLIEETSIDIYAILDCRRDPSWIRDLNAPCCRFLVIWVSPKPCRPQSKPLTYTGDDARSPSTVTSARRKRWGGCGRCSPR